MPRIEKGRDRRLFAHAHGYIYTCLIPVFVFLGPVCNLGLFYVRACVVCSTLFLRNTKCSRFVGGIHRHRQEKEVAKEDETATTWLPGVLLG